MDRKPRYDVLSDLQLSILPTTWLDNPFVHQLLALKRPARTTPCTESDCARAVWGVVVLLGMIVGMQCVR